MSHMLIKHTVTFSKKKFEHKYTNDNNFCKIKDHCHYTGKYRRGAHSICNLSYSIPK